MLSGLIEEYVSSFLDTLLGLIDSYVSDFIFDELYFSGELFSNLTFRLDRLLFILSAY